METTFFDLPLDLRHVVYRHARFLEARRRVAKLMERRSMPTMSDPMIPGIKNIEVEMSIHSTKKMKIVRCETHTALRILFDTVEIFNDDCGVRVVLRVEFDTMHARFDDKLSLFIGTRRRETHYIGDPNSQFCFSPTKTWMYINENKNVMLGPA